MIIDMEKGSSARKKTKCKHTQKETRIGDRHSGGDSLAPRFMLPYSVIHLLAALLTEAFNAGESTAAL